MLSASALQRIDREVAKYPPERKQSAVMAALIIAQDERGWLATETMDDGGSNRQHCNHTRPRGPIQPLCHCNSESRTG